MFRVVFVPIDTTKDYRVAVNHIDTFVYLDHAEPEILDDKTIRFLFISSMLCWRESKGRKSTIVALKNSFSKS
jgi:hypothetical protein